MSTIVAAERAAALSFRQLRLFKAIGDLRSVRRAADHCNLSQPAVTQSLAKLEEQVRATLVDRRANGSYLNACGGIFHARIDRLFSQINLAVIECNAGCSPAAAQAIANRLTRSQIRTLLDAISHGSLKRASQEVGISLSSLQRSGRDLESNLGVSLFHRTVDGILVSPAGIQLGRRLRLALQEIAWGIDEIDAVGGETNQQIVIGAMPFGGSVLLASVLDGFLRLSPKADVRIINESAPAMMKCLREGSVDLVIGLLPERLPDEIAGMRLTPTPYSVVVGRGHPLIHRGKVTLTDLLAYDWIVGTAGSSRRACFDHLFLGGVGPKARIATCALTVQQYLLKHSNRLSLMTSYELEHSDGALQALPFEPILPIPSLGILTRAGWLPTMLHNCFISTVQAEASAVTQPLRRAS